MGCRARIITDRYALPDGADTNACNTTAQTWCGGTWNTIRENLDYVQDMGFTASASRPVCIQLCLPLLSPSTSSRYSLRHVSPPALHHRKSFFFVHHFREPVMMRVTLAKSNYILSYSFWVPSRAVPYVLMADIRSLMVVFRFVWRVGMGRTLAGISMTFEYLSSLACNNSLDQPCIAELRRTEDGLWGRLPRYVSQVNN